MTDNPNLYFDEWAPLTANEYQACAQETAIYPGRGTMAGLLYAALGLAGEAGEVANKVKKILRDDAGQLTDAKKDELLLELGDVAWYLAALCEECGWSLESVMLANLDKLAARQKRDTLNGTGDVR